MADELRIEIKHYLTKLTAFWMELCKGGLNSEQLEDLFHTIHPFKGLALAGSEKELTKCLHEVEEFLLEGRGNVDLKSQLEKIMSLGNELLAQKESEAAQSLTAFVTEFISSLKKQLGKEIELEIENLVAIPPQLSSDIKECLVPVLMNAVYHGTAAEEGKINFTVREEKGCLVLEVFDSGKDVIRNSQTEVNFYSGRGKGLDAAKKKALSLDGHLSVASLGARGTLVKLVLPLKPELAEAS